MCSHTFKSRWLRTSFSGRSAVLMLSLLMAGLAETVGGQVITAFSVPGGAEAITAGPDGNLWFTQRLNQIGRMTTSGAVAIASVPTANSSLIGITAGPDDNLWFTEYDASKIGRITTTGVITEFPTPIGLAYPRGIAAGADGNLWFGGISPISRITTAGVITAFETGFNVTYGVARGPDGNIWFTEAGGYRIGRVTPTGVVSRFPIPAHYCRPLGIAAGPDGNLWFTEADGNQIGRITTAGAITEFPIPTASSVPASIAAGPDGNLWFTENSGNQIGRITTTGAITEFPLPDALSGPWDITTGPDGNLWFTEGGGIGRITTGRCVSDSTTLCLNQSRFQVTVDWEVPREGRSGHGTAVPITADTGAFWFFNSDNTELVIKALDAREVNGRFWIFYGALSNVQYTITVTDMATGAVKTYENPDGTLASVADTTAFNPTGAAVETQDTASSGEIERRSAEELYGLYARLTETARAKIAPSPCTPGSTTLCLNESRFHLTVDWEVPAEGRSGHGTAVPLSGDTGYFWFFNGDNVELVIKVLDGTAHQRSLLGLLRRPFQRPVHDHRHRYLDGNPKDLHQPERHARQRRRYVGLLKMRLRAPPVHGPGLSRLRSSRSSLLILALLAAGLTGLARGRAATDDGITVAAPDTIRAASHFLYRTDGQGGIVPVAPEQQLAAEANDFPAMRAAGFNSVLLVEFRKKFDSPDGLSNLRMELQTARQNGIRVLMGLNYGADFEIARTTTPDELTLEAARLQSWLSFVVGLLSGVEDYADTVYPFVFEEGAVPADIANDWESRHDWIATRLGATIGNTPALLPPALRARFSLGWYGAWSSIEDARPASGFDWVGQGRFYFDPSIGLTWVRKGLTDDEIVADLTETFAHLRAMYPGLPIVLVEGGYCTCDSSTFERAAEVYSLLARFCLASGYGWNLWGYRTLLTPEQECAARGGKGGHSLTNPDGSPRPALRAVEDVLRERGARMPPRRISPTGRVPRVSRREPGAPPHTQ